MTYQSLDETPLKRNSKMLVDTIVKFIFLEIFQRQLIKFQIGDRPKSQNEYDNLWEWPAYS